MPLTFYWFTHLPHGLAERRDEVDRALHASDPVRSMQEILANWHASRMFPEWHALLKEAALIYRGDFAALYASLQAYPPREDGGIADEFRRFVEDLTKVRLGLASRDVWRNYSEGSFGIEVQTLARIQVAAALADAGLHAEALDRMPIAAFSGHDWDHYTVTQSQNISFNCFIALGRLKDADRLLRLMNPANSNHSSPIQRRAHVRRHMDLALAQQDEASFQYWLNHPDVAAPASPLSEILILQSKVNFALEKGSYVLAEEAWHEADQKIERSGFGRSYINLDLEMMWLEIVQGGISRDWSEELQKRASVESNPARRVEYQVLAAKQALLTGDLRRALAFGLGATQLAAKLRLGPSRFRALVHYWAALYSSGDQSLSQRTLGEIRDVVGLMGVPLYRSVWFYLQAFQHQSTLVGARLRRLTGQEMSQRLAAILTLVSSRRQQLSLRLSSGPAVVHSEAELLGKMQKAGMTIWFPEERIFVCSTGGIRSIDLVKSTLLVQILTRLIRGPAPLTELHKLRTAAKMNASHLDALKVSLSRLRRVVRPIGLDIVSENKLVSLKGNLWVAEAPGARETSHLRPSTSRLRQQIIVFVRERKSVTMSELIEKFELSQQALYQHLLVLISQKEIISVGKNRGRLYLSGSSGVRGRPTGPKLQGGSRK